MKRICIPLCILMVIACQDEPASDPSAKRNDTAASVPESATKAESPARFEGPVISERIDGPANIRNSANGKVIFSLEDNVAVTAREPQQGWLEIGVAFDLDPSGSDTKTISKGTTLMRNSKPIGQTKEDVPVYQVITGEANKKLGVLNGFTSLSNIQPATILENAFAELAKDKPTLLKADMKPFLDSYKFEDFNGLATGNQGYVFYESGLLDASARPRFWPVFRNNELMLVFHGRRMEIPGVQTRPFEDGYITVFSKDEAAIKDLKKKFVSFMRSAG